MQQRRLDSGGDTHMVMSRARMAKMQAQFNVSRVPTCARDLQRGDGTRTNQSLQGTTSISTEARCGNVWGSDTPVVVVALENHDGNEDGDTLLVCPACVHQLESTGMESILEDMRCGFGLIDVLGAVWFMTQWRRAPLEPALWVNGQVEDEATIM